MEDAGGEDSEDEAECEMQLVWAHTPTYPDEAPCIRLRSLRGLSDAELAEATAELQRHIEVPCVWRARACVWVGS